MAKNTRVKGTNFESLGFGFELPHSLMGTVGAVRVMRVEYDHYSKMCKSNKIPPIASKDIPSYIEQLDCRLKDLEQAMYEKKVKQKREQREQEALQRAKEEEERERLRLQKLERKTKAKAGKLTFHLISYQLNSFAAAGDQKLNIGGAIILNYPIDFQTSFYRVHF